MKKFLFLAILAVCAAASVEAQSRINTLRDKSDPRGKPELIVCSQNMDNFGGLIEVRVRKPNFTQEMLDVKIASLVQRFGRIGCDVIAMQELLSRNVELGKVFLDSFAKQLQFFTGRFFETRVGRSNDKISRLAFLVAKDKADVVNQVSYAQVQLPTMTKKEKPRMFVRGPLEIQLQTKSTGKESNSKLITLVNFHFKSKRGGKDDAARLEWETYRMQMAEALRRIVVQRHASALESGSTPLLMLGDRNSNFDVASARILEGTLKLGDFRGSAPCRLSKRGVPLCQPGTAQGPLFFSVLTTDPDQFRTAGTYRFKDVYSWLDDILMPQVVLPFAWKRFDVEGRYESGTYHLYPQASDHALIYVHLNW